MKDKRFFLMVALLCSLLLTGCIATNETSGEMQLASESSPAIEETIEEEATSVADEDPPEYLPAEGR